MPLPTVLIIGAMKAGTTSLYMDLVGHPQVFMPGDKEPHALSKDEVLSPSGLAQYETIYAKARENQICCDASTGYSKRPDIEGVAERAVRVLPADFKVIYVVRHPIDRIISQHHHEHFEGHVGPSIDEEVRRHPRYVQYSRYRYQLEPWIAAVGLPRIQVIRFEDYIAARREVVESVLEFVGLRPENGLPAEQRVYNKSRDKPVKGPFWNFIQHHPFYRRYLRPFAPPKLRLAVRDAVLSRAIATLAPPQSETIEYLRQSLVEDARGLSDLLKLDRPMWPDF